MKTETGETSKLKLSVNKGLIFANSTTLEAKLCNICNTSIKNKKKKMNENNVAKRNGNINFINQDDLVAIYHVKVNKIDNLEKINFRSCVHNHFVVKRLKNIIFSLYSTINTRFY